MSQFDRSGGVASDGERADRIDGTDGAAAAARTESRVPPAEVFAVLGNETRVEVLHALLELGGDESPVSFTDLFDRVDATDSANFSYHLDQLTGHFVRRREEGYELRAPGRKVVSSIFTGTLTERAQLGFFPAEGSCHACGGDLHGWYVDDTLSIGCTDCGAIQVSYPFPAGALDGRSTDDLLEAFHHYVRHHYCLAADGVCPECTGTVETDLVRTPDEEGQAVAVEHACRRCSYDLRSTVGLLLLDDPDVLRFHADRGVDLSSTPFWEFDWCVSDAATTVVSEEPLRVRLTAACAGDEMRVGVDESGRVVETDGPELDAQ
ncbi:ArsR/SmtB family transcription factor [Halorubrum tebenquichense]|uniref:Putative ArsR family transcriptional regulator n=1 Tax=Halorubrum tebenquichense DSM 14210 TaxID=1227485 RepID=M0DZR6_9EURY|nr:helix-turn-helix domain-containing protein [Halorubrum tebenquichense]ELZ39579.1 putative ArsR family transcriptional regulator [Halorubrum tebenquichense DSM 14210]